MSCRYFQTLSDSLTYNNTPIKIYNQNNHELGSGSHFLNKYLPRSSSQTYEETENDDCEDEFAYLGDTGEPGLLDDYFDEHNAVETSSTANSDIHCQRRSLPASNSSKKPTYAVNKSFPGQPAGGEKKFIRKFNDSTRAQLELKFAQNNFISRVEKDELAAQLNLTERQVKKWFEKRREKKRRLERQAFDVSGGSAAYLTSMKSHKKKRDVPNQADASVASTSMKNFSNNLKLEPTEANYYDRSDEPTFGELKSTKMTTQVN